MIALEDATAKTIMCLLGMLWTVLLLVAVGVLWGVLASLGRSRERQRWYENRYMISDEKPWPIIVERPVVNGAFLVEGRDYDLDEQAGVITFRAPR